MVALNWIGAAALPDLFSMVRDPDPELADQAAEFYSNHASMLEEDAKAKAYSSVLRIASPRTLDYILQKFSDLPMETLIPPLLTLLPSADSEIQAKATEWLRFLSQGEDYQTAEEWNAWYKGLKLAHPPQASDGSL